MTTVHFVYPHGDRISCPHAIGRKVGERLQRRYEVVHYDIDDVRAIDPGPDDVLLGHPHEAPWTILRRSARRRGWRRVIVLMPYVHTTTYHVALADPVIRNADLFLAITGATWFEAVPSSISAHWLPKMVHVDLAVDGADFPRVKKRFNEPGRRRFVYIGHTGAYKNTPYLAEIARRLSEVEFSWIGSGDPPISGFRELGRRDFRTKEALELVAGHDFLITVGSGDANPSTILEAMSWGLIPVCTPESGYAGRPGIVNVPLGDVDRTVEILRELQGLPESRLLELRASNDEALRTHFNWDRFTEQVVEAIESTASPPCVPLPRAENARIRWLSTRMQLAVLVPSNFRFLVRSLLLSNRLGRALLKRRRRRWAARTPS